MKVLAVVPARCGSKGFPNKNLAIINGVTLLEIAINVGLNCVLIDDVYVSTDSNEYLTIAKKFGAKSVGLRHAHLSTDEAKSVDVVIDLIRKLDNKYDYLVLLQPTSPIREPLDIENMIELIEQNNADACVSVCHFDEPHPYKLKSISEEGLLVSFIDGSSSEVARQSLPKAYALNGAIYVVRIDALLKQKTFFPIKTLPYVMENNINIDSEEDFVFLEAMQKLNKIKIWDTNLDQ